MLFKNILNTLNPLLLISCLLIACKKEIPPKGIIIQSFSQIKCIELLRDTSFAIQSDSAYVRYKNRYPNCSSFPNIDFNQQTLLAQYYSASCNDEVYPQVNDLADSKQYEYKLIICKKKCKNKSAKVGLVFVSVPKLPSTYSIKYGLEYK
jgi:hypothetical protein